MPALSLCWARRKSILIVSLAAGLAYVLAGRLPLLADDESKSAQPLKIARGNHICIIGNTLADRMQHDGWLETLIQTRFAKLELVMRNLGYSGDELTIRLRSAMTASSVSRACSSASSSFNAWSWAVRRLRHRAIRPAKNPSPSSTGK